MSHSGRAVFGRSGGGPRLVASKPFSRFAAGEDLVVRVVAASDREVRTVTLRWRMAGQRTWQTASMLNRFRQSYVGVVSGSLIPAGTVEFFVEATDGDGKRSVWPESAPAVAWSATVV